MKKLTNNNPKAVIFGIRGKQLLPEEEDFIRQHNPLGFILFSRNIENKLQVKQLVKQLKSVANRFAPILIDQEGGRVARLKQPNWRHPPKAEIFGRIAKQDIKAAHEACKLNAKLIALDLYELGINTNCAPLLDIFSIDAHSVIGDRAFSEDREIVTSLGLEMIKGFISCGVCPIIKHIPGHGRATADSHLELPIVTTNYNDLLANDFFPFIKLRHAAKWAMTAHILYSAIDAQNPATFSPKVIKEIRNEIGFKGIIITDCITMKALDGDMAKKANKSFTAGCDLVLHSNSNLDEMTLIIREAPQLTDNQLSLIEESYNELRIPSNILNYTELSRRFEQIMQEFEGNSITNICFDPTERF
jgi:beta-N-acetylhexosaminidase